MARGAIYTADPNRQAIFSEMNALEAPFTVTWVHQSLPTTSSIGGTTPETFSSKDMWAVADVPLGSLPSQADAFVLVTSIQATITSPPLVSPSGLGPAKFYIDGDWTPEGRPERMMNTYDRSGDTSGSDPVTRTWHQPIPPPNIKAPEPDPAGSWRYQHPDWPTEYVAEFDRALGYWLFHEGIRDNHAVVVWDFNGVNAGLGRVWPTQVAVRSTYTYREDGSTSITFGDLRLIVIPYRCVPGVLTLT